MPNFTKILPLFAFVLLLPFAAKAQLKPFHSKTKIPDPVSFSVKKAPKQVKTGQQFQAVIHAKIKGKWHIYAVHLDPNAGPFPTKITTQGKALKIDGKIKESKPETAFDPNFKAQVSWHSKKANFTIPLKLESKPDSKLAVDITYQACNDKVCMPPKKKSVILPTKVQGVTLSGNNSNKKAGSASTMADANNQGFTTSNHGAGGTSSAGKTASTPTLTKSSVGGNGIFSFLWIALLAGFAALLTPCVFPMIPLTVSYFSKQESQGRGVGRAFGFGAAIVITFTLLGAVLALIIGAAGALEFASNPWVNLFIALILIAFGLSLLGAFELRLPYKFTNYLNRKGNEGSGLTGIIFIALTISAVSFSCTAPFVGAVLAATVQGQWFYPIIGMIGFSAAFASPFVIFALFPKWMESLPKSGSWMNIAKVLLGFIELAAAIKYLSNADLVWGTNIISRPFAIAIWIALFLLATFYVLGVYALKHEKKPKSIGVSRLIISIPLLLFCFYLIPGLLGSSLGIWDAWLPPKKVSDIGVIASTAVNNGVQANTRDVWSHNYQAALKKASTNGRAIFIDFSGYTCTNCRAMETNVFPLPNVQKRFKKMALVRLYTDGGQHGKENRKLQFELTGTVALPTYAIVNPNTKRVITQKMGYIGKEKFLKFLNRGLQEFVHRDGRHVERLSD
jgi:thiol:disulfide interchange protein DsbD